MELTIPYHKMLQDPRWKEKREKIKARDGSKCVACDSTEDLQVHHGYYRPLAPPWEYEEKTLWTLCGVCHEKATEVTIKIHRAIGLMHPRDYEELNNIIPATVFKAEYGLSPDDAYITTHPYCDYSAVVESDPEFNFNLILELQRNAMREFPGIVIDIGAGAVHGTAIVTGPDETIIADIQDWFDVERGRLSC